VLQCVAEWLQCVAVCCSIKIHGMPCLCISLSTKQPSLSVSLSRARFLSLSVSRARARSNRMPSLRDKICNDNLPAPCILTTPKLCTVKPYGVATISRLLQIIRLQIIRLFCRIYSLLQGSCTKETYDFKEPTNRRHPITPNPKPCAS